MTIQMDEGKFSGAYALLWVDLETTGTDEKSDDIIEIGAVLTDFNLNKIGTSFSQVVEPDDFALGRLMKNQVVRQMHEANGLLDDVISGRSVDIATAQHYMYKWITLAINHRVRKGDPAKFRFMLAGSGVAHFDRRFIKQELPLIDGLLTFSPLDVGMVRRFLKLSGVEVDSVGDNSDRKNHRALDDIELHLEEARAYKALFQQFLPMDIMSSMAGVPVPAQRKEVK